MNVSLMGYLSAPTRHWHDGLGQHRHELQRAQRLDQGPAAEGPAHHLHSAPKRAERGQRGADGYEEKPDDWAGG